MPRPCNMLRKSFAAPKFPGSSRRFQPGSLKGWCPAAQHLAELVVRQLVLEKSWKLVGLCLRQGHPTGLPHER